MSFRLQPCAPTGSSTAFACPGFVPIEMPNYRQTDEGRAFRLTRLDLDLTLGDAARALGLKPSDVSGLENGRCVPVDTEDWARMAERMEGAKR